MVPVGGDLEKGSEAEKFEKHWDETCEEITIGFIRVPFIHLHSGESSVCPSPILFAGETLLQGTSARNSVLQNILWEMLS